MKYLPFAAILLALAMVLAPGCGRAEDDLVIISPHDEKITQEITLAFEKVFEKANGRKPRISWRDIGGGGEAQVRFIVDQYGRSPNGIDVDLFFGGGIDPFKTLKGKGLLERYVPPTAAEIPAKVLGVPIMDEDGCWSGTVLSTFGIVYNKTTLKRLGVDEPKTWEDMTNPKLIGFVGLADPGRSASARVIYETILQAYGWDKGMRVLTLMSANALTFYPGSSGLAKDVTGGDIAVGPAIDYYGRTQVALGGADRLGFVTPANLTVITPDPIAILKGAPHMETAKMFVDFVMSDAGQKLWLTKAGAPGGPEKYNLMRSPVLPRAYKEVDRSLWTIDVDPFSFAGAFTFDSVKASARREILNDVMQSTLVVPQKDLRECWKAVLAAGSPEALLARMSAPPMTEEELLKTAESWGQADFRARLTTQWTESARKRYRAVKDEAEKGK